MEIKFNFKKRISPLEMYTRMLESKLKSNSNKINLKVYGDAKLSLTYDKLISATSISKFYKLTNIAMYMPNDLISLIRNVETTGTSSTERVNVNFNFKLEPHVIDWNDRTMQVRAANWEKDIEDTAEEDNKLLKDDHTIAVLKQNDWIKKSWEYFKDACGRGCATPVLTLIVELQTLYNSREDLKALKVAEQRLMNICSNKHIILKPISGNLWDFLRYFSPTCVHNSRIERSIEKFPVTDEIVANFTDYTPGKLSDTEVLIGLDIDTAKFVYKNFVDKFGGAETLLISAVTGGGKSYMCKSIVINMLLYGYCVVVMDRDGEYIPLAEKYNGVVISMNQAEGKYFDSVEIADLTGDDKVDKTLLSESRITTTAIFNCLCDKNKGMTSNELAMFNDAYNIMYERNGVDLHDKYTWYNSKKLSFYTLYDTIKSLRENKKYIKRYGRELEDFIDKLKVYFERDGIYNFMFQKRITTDEIFKGMLGKAPMVDLHMDLHDEGEAELDTATVLKMLMTTYLSNMILNFNKKNKRFTFDVVEEFQRYLTNPIAKGITVTKATGNRKRDAITVIITNNPGELASSLVNDKALAAIRGNITSSIIGKLQSLDDIKPICKNLNLANCESELEEMYKDPVLHRHCFVAKFDGREAAVIKAIVPPSLINSSVFETRDTEKR